MINKKLEQLGLSDKEAKTYLAILELGEASIQDIANKAGINRVTCHVAVEALKEQGLLNEITKGKKRKIIAEMPDKLLEHIIDRRTEYDRRASELEKLLPELQSIYNYSDVKPKIRFYEGIEGLKEIYQDTLAEGVQEILAFTAYNKAEKELSNWLDKWYIPERIKRNVHAQVIAPVSDFAKKYKSADKKHKRETILIPASQFPISIEINIYGNKVAIMSFTKKEMMGVIIESKEVAHTFKLIYKLAWSGAEQLKK